MYQEGVPRGAIKNRKTWGIAPRAINPGGTIKKSMSPHNFYFIYLIHSIYVGLFRPIYFLFFYMSSALLLLCLPPPPPTPEHVPPPLVELSLACSLLTVENQTKKTGPGPGSQTKSSQL